MRQSFVRHLVLCVLFVLILALAGPAGATGSPAAEKQPECTPIDPAGYKVQAVPLVFPSVPPLSGPEPLIRAEICDYRPHNPGLGVGAHYRFQGATLSLYIYDKGLNLAAVNARDFAAKEAAAAVGDIRDMVKKGVYAGVEETSPTRTVTLSGVEMLELDFAITRTSGATMLSTLLITVHKNQIFKIRLSLDPGRPNAKALAQDLLPAAGAILFPAR